MTPRAEVPELTFHGLHYCDLCGEPLIPGETLCGLCRTCRTAPPSRDRAPRVPRRKRRRQDLANRWN